jgi:hypothetical protein
MGIERKVAIPAHTLHNMPNHPHREKGWTLFEMAEVTMASGIGTNLLSHHLSHVRVFVEHLPKQAQKGRIAGLDATLHHFLGLIEQQAPL